jgi:hypothetical protein
MSEKSLPFCNVPWTSFQVHPSREVSACCINNKRISSYIDFDLRTIHHNPMIQSLRKAFMEGQFHPSCYGCDSKEKLGAQSTRLNRLKNVGWRPEQSGHELLNAPMDLRYLDIAFSKVCNLRCRFCNPDYSSKWQSDMKKYDEIDQYMSKQLFVPEDRVETISIAQLKEILDASPNIEIVEIKGGEPFLSSVHMEFLQLLIERGLSERVQLLYSTNGTISMRDYIPLFRKFKDISISISMEGQGEIYKYMRGGDIEISEVVQNVSEIASLSNVRLNTHFLMTALNVFAIRPFEEWARSHLVPLGAALGVPRVVRGPEPLRPMRLPKVMLREAIQGLGDVPTRFNETARRILSVSLQDASEEGDQQFWEYVLRM